MLTVRLSFLILGTQKYPTLLLILDLNYNNQSARLYLIPKPSFEKSFRTDLEKAYLHNNSYILTIIPFNSTNAY